MPDSKGRFVWYELMTTDTRAAGTFYGDVVGWGTQDASMPDMSYTMFTVAGVPVGGLMDLPEASRKLGVPPNWIGYVAVDDVDASAAQAQRLGGTVNVPPTDIPGVGRFAVISDPQKAVLALFASSSPGQDTPAAQGTPGRMGWHELLAADGQAAFGFYSALFGWQKGDAIDMGAMGPYQLFLAGGEMAGGMMTKPPSVPAPFWLYYVNVADIDAAGARVKAGGGTILNGPMEVPGGDWIIQASDPQGAMFALLGKRGQAA